MEGLILEFYGIWLIKYQIHVYHMPPKFSMRVPSLIHVVS